jgi:hypothetical protein
MHSLLLDSRSPHNYWNDLTASAALFDRSFTKATHRALISPSGFLDVSPLEIDSELEGFIHHRKKSLTSYRSCRGKETGMLDALFSICLDFYNQHSQSNLRELEKRAKDRCQHFSTTLGIHSYPITSSDLPIELAFKAMSRFSEFCLSEEPSLDPDKLNIAMIKCWVGWVEQHVNISIYPFVSQILHRLEETHTLKSAEEGNSDLVHFCLFGAFISSKENQKPEHQPVKLFITEPKANQFILQVLSYKIMLNLIEHTLNTRLPLQPGIIYTVDPAKMRVTDCIRIDQLIKSQVSR